MTYRGPHTRESMELQRPARWGHVRLASVDTQIDIWLLGLLVAWMSGGWIFWVVLGWLIVLVLRWLWLAVEMDVTRVS